MSYLWVVAGAAAGGSTRYVLDLFVQRRRRSNIPWGTITVNLIACLTLGVVTGATLPSNVQLALGTGFSATLSTYSAFSYETVRLARQASQTLSLSITSLSVIGGVAVASLGTTFAARI